MYIIDSLVGSGKERYLEKLKMIGLTNCPYTIAAEFWENNPTQWPNLEYPEVYQYLTESPGIFTREAMANRKSLEAYNLCVSGWIRTVHHFYVGIHQKHLYR